jgi:hypothetical protein
MPSVYAVGAAASGLGAVLPGIPTGTDANDVLILLMESDPVLDPAAIGAVTGYAEVQNSPSSQTGGLPTRLTVRWHRATGPESGTVSVPDAGNHVVARIIGFRGCVTSGSPWNQTAASQENVSDTSVSIDGLTTTAIDCLILAAFTTGQDVASTTHVGTWANASLANVVERVDDWSAAGTGGGIGAATGEKATAGVVAATTATLTTANFKAQFCMALQGAVAAPGNPHQRRRGARHHPNIRR